MATGSDVNIPGGRFSSAVPRLPGVGIFEHLLPEDRMRISDGFAQILGLDSSYADCVGQVWLSRFHPEDEPRLRAEYAALLERGTGEIETQYRVRHEDGSWVWVLSRSRWEDRADGPGRMVRGYVMDVTWQHRMDLQAGIIERMNEGVMLLERGGTIRFVNAALERTLGYASHELLGADAHVLSFRTREAFDGLLETAFGATANGSSALIDLEGRRRDGGMLPLQGRLSSLQLGGTRYLLAVFTDISSRKQLEREVLQMATQVQQRVGGDLHEGLGQLLSGIAMMLQGLKARAVDLAPQLGKELEQVVTLINGAVRRTRLLARGLSPVRASTQGVMEGFEELVNNVLEVYGQRVRLSMDLPPELAADENSVMNLFHIAQEAVENAARHAGARDIHIHVSLAGPDLELQVSDDGVGFDPSQISRSGLGMGLRMMRFRAEMARGYLSIESRPGHGARLRCRCPARTGSKA
jgi:PAS domain S-box-containing protein